MDAGVLDVGQEDMEEELFSVLEGLGCVCFFFSVFFFPFLSLSRGREKEGEGREGISFFALGFSSLFFSPFSFASKASKTLRLGPDAPIRFRRASSFLASRRGLLVLVCGGPCSGKSALASALAARLNLGAPVHVDALAEALREQRRGGSGIGGGGGGAETFPLSSSSEEPSSSSSSAAAAALGGDDGCLFGGGPLPSRPPWTTPKEARKRGGEGGEEEDDGGFDSEKWDREARALRAALSRDLLKAARDGRSAVIEGGGLDPGLFTGVLAAPLARAWEEAEDEEGGSEEEEEEGGDRGRRHHQRLFRRPPAAGGPPAIVPILVEMEPAHQALLVREACERDPGLAASEADGIEEAVKRAAAAARHVGARAAAAALPPPPLVGLGSAAVLRVATSLRAGDAERAVARLHAALLGVMEAMASASSADGVEGGAGKEEDVE